MDWPYRFPHPAEVIAADAEQLQALSIEARLERLFALIAGGAALFDARDWEAHRRLKDCAEAEWRASHQKVLELHGR